MKELIYIFSIYDFENFEILLIFDFRHSLGCAIHPLLFVPPILYLVVLAVLPFLLQTFGQFCLHFPLEKNLLKRYYHEPLARIMGKFHIEFGFLENNAPIHLYTARDYVLVPDEQQRSRPGSL
ncbi:unnamed protein product [Rhizophagus irregularis]|nr:unnamed protein product [Rhizophagus irregularis]